jgi:CHC2 zinc finger
VDSHKDLFYCYGCGRGGDVIRFAELYHQVKFPQALTLLRQWRGAEPLLVAVQLKFEGWPKVNRRSRR